MAENGVPSFKVPQIAGSELNLFKLYNGVTSRGGYELVSSSKLWRVIVQEFNLPPTATSASFTLRTHYQRCLLPYELKYFSNSSDGAFNQAMQNSANRVRPVVFARNQKLSFGAPIPPLNVTTANTMSAVAVSINAEVPNQNLKKVRVS